MENDSLIWTPKGFVTIEEWQNRTKEIKQDGVLYPASVPSILSLPYGSILKQYGHRIFGDNEKQTNIDCGEKFRIRRCSKDSSHYQIVRHIRCNDVGCPICYGKPVSRSAERVTERWQGYKQVYRWQKPFHLILWSSKEEGESRLYPRLSEAFTEADRLLKILGVKASSVWFHPYRIKPELKPHMRRWRRANGLDGRIGFWKMAHDDILGIGTLENYMVYGPHWHGIATGFLMNSKKFEELTGAGYKKRRYLETESAIHEVAYYISTHAAREWGKQSVRYYGDISYRMLARELVEERIVEQKCPECGAPIEEHVCNTEGVCLEKLRDCITEKIKYYLYWKRGTEKPIFKGMLDRIEKDYTQ